jgi:BirA family transcriptional regulator, biotin operon repressor / biotin---[acetyl-CoA-carboxylase] ligase
MPGSPATWSDAFREWRDPHLSRTRFSPVQWFESIDSTNRYALEQATKGAGEGLVVVADEQTAGRGRLGRAWVAPPQASLLVSVVLRPQLPVERRHLLTLAAALAAVEAVDEVAGVVASIKWPNDVVVADRKLAGILAEAASDAVVVGMGLNVRWDAFPPELTRTATALNLCGASDDVDTSTVLAAWLPALESRLSHVDDIPAAAQERSATLGRPVRVELPSEVLTGIATSLTDDGYLVVRQDDGIERVITSGDVVHLRPTG